MRKNVLLCALVIIMLFVMPSYSAEEIPQSEGFTASEGYDPQNTMLALNMAVVSVHRILATQSRAVLDDEYQNIINNLSLGNIRSDPEIAALYTAEENTPSEGFTASEGYDPQNTMLALNMAVVSVHRILTTQSRAVLDDEYQNIINNLSLGNIRSDPEITALYEKLLDIAGRKKLRTDEAERLRKAYSEQAKRSISGALSDFGKSSASMIRNEGSIGAFFGSFSSLVSVSAASYFKYQTGGLNLNGSLNENLYRLNTEDLADFNDLQKQLLSSSWNLLNRYKLPDEYRLVQRSIDDFSQAVEKTDDPSRRLRMLQAMEADFRVYPPYWYYRAKAAYDCKNFDEAGKCFDTFEEVYRPVLRKDPYMLETAKYRINEIVSENLQNTVENRDTILELCRIMRENTLRDDWVNNLFAGAVYYALDEKSTGIMCAQINIDFGYEQELSGEILRIMRANVPSGLLLREALRSLKLNELTANMSSRDKFTALMIADCFDDKDGAAERLRTARRTPVALHMLRLEAFSSDGRADFEALRGLAENMPVSGDELSRDYAVIMPVVKSYSDDENPMAYAFLADMYLYGWGVGENSELAAHYYMKAAEKGEPYSQVMYTNMLIHGRLDPKDEQEIMPVSENESQQLSQDAKPRKKSKPLIRFWPFKK